MRVAVEHGDHRHVLLVGGDERLQPRARRAEAAIEAIRTGHDEHVGEHTLRREQARRRQRLRDHHARGEDMHGAISGIARRLAGVAQPIAAAQRRIAIRLGRRRREGLVDRARRQSQIETLALARSDGREAVEEDPLHLARERRLEVGDGGQRHADRGRDHRLVSAALGRQRDAGRRGGHDEPATGVERVIEGVEAPRYERVVERADRQQRRARHLRGEAERSEEKKEVVLGDAQLDVTARRRFAPGHGLRRVGERIGPRLQPVHARAVDPAREVRRHRDVGGDGDDRVALGAARERAEDAAERLLRGHRARVRLVERARHGRCGRTRRRRPQRRQPAHVRRLGAGGIEPGPFLARHDAKGLAQLGDLGWARDHRVVERIGRGGQSPALDRVGQDHRRPAALALGLVERLEDRREIVAANIGHERGQRVVREAGEGAIEVGVERAGRRGDERLTHGARRQPQQPLILAARHRLEPAAQPLTARATKRGLEPPAPPQLPHAPAVGAEEIGQLPRARVRHHAIETLPVHVHDPEHVPEPGERLLAQRLPHVAFVELGVADHDHETLGRARRAVVDEVACRESAERGHDRAESHGAGREVDDVGVLAPARIRLQAPKFAQRRETRATEPPAQELDGVEGRRRACLRGDDVAGPERLEVEGGEETHHRGGGCLVATDLGAVHARARVGLVHHPRGEPEHAALDALEDLELGHPALRPQNWARLSSLPPSTCAYVQRRGALSGRQRRNFVP